MKTNEDYKKRTAFWLKRARGILLIDQLPLGKKLGVSRQTISNYETGKHQLPGGLLLEIMDMLRDNKKEDMLWP